MTAHNRVRTYVIGRLVLDAFLMLMFASITSMVAWRSFHTSNAAVPGRMRLHQDFDDTIYFPVRAAWSGINPYNSSRDEPGDYGNQYPVSNHFPLYSPLLLLVFAVFAIPPLLPATALYMAFNLSILFCFCWLVLHLTVRSVRLATVCGLTGLLLLTLPIRSTVHWGQVTLLLNLVLLGAIHWGDRNWHRSGWLLLLGTIKATFGGPAACLLAARGDWKSAVTGIALGGIIFVAGMGIVFGRAGDLSLPNGIDVLVNNQQHFRKDPFVVTSANPLRVDAASAFEYLSGVELASLWSISVGVGVLALGCWVIWKTRQPGIPEHAASTRSAFLILTLFLCIYHQLPELVLALLPIAASLTCSHASWKCLTPMLRIVFAGLVSVPFLNVFQIHAVQKLLLDIPANTASSAVFATPLLRFSSAANGCSLFVAWLLLGGALLLRTSGSENKIAEEQLIPPDR